MDIPSTLLALFECNYLVTDGFSRQRASDVEYFLNGYPQYITEQTVELPVISDALHLADVTVISDSALFLWLLLWSRDPD